MANWALLKVRAESASEDDPILAEAIYGAFGVWPEGAPLASMDDAITYAQTVFPSWSSFTLSNHCCHESEEDENGITRWTKTGPLCCLARLEPYGHVGGRAHTMPLSIIVAMIEVALHEAGIQKEPAK